MSTTVLLSGEYCDCCSPCTICTEDPYCTPPSACLPVNGPCYRGHVGCKYPAYKRGTGPLPFHMREDDCSFCDLCCNSGCNWLYHRYKLDWYTNKPLPSINDVCDNVTSYLTWESGTCVWSADGHYPKFTLTGHCDSGSILIELGIGDITYDNGTYRVESPDSIIEIEAALSCSFFGTIIEASGLEVEVPTSGNRNTYPSGNACPVKDVEYSLCLGPNPGLGPTEMPYTCFGSTINDWNDSNNFTYGDCLHCDLPYGDSDEPPSSGERSFWVEIPTGIMFWTQNTVGVNRFGQLGCATSVCDDGNLTVSSPIYLEQGGLPTSVGFASCLWKRRRNCSDSNQGTGGLSRIASLLNLSTQIQGYGPLNGAIDPVFYTFQAPLLIFETITPNWSYVIAYELATDSFNCCGTNDFNLVYYGNHYHSSYGPPACLVVESGWPETITLRRTDGEC